MWYILTFNHFESFDFKKVVKSLIKYLLTYSNDMVILGKNAWWQRQRSMMMIEFKGNNDLQQYSEMRRESTIACTPSLGNVWVALI